MIAHLRFVLASLLLLLAAASSSNTTNENPSYGSERGTREDPDRRQAITLYAPQGGSFHVKPGELGRGMT